MIRAFSILMAAALTSLSASGQDVYRAFTGDRKAQAMVVKQLESIQLKGVKIERLSLPEAVALLQQLGAGEPPQPGGVINHIIRGDEAPRVSLQADAISFAQAIDRICTQAGYRWSIQGETNHPPSSSHRIRSHHTPPFLLRRTVTIIASLCSKLAEPSEREMRMYDC